MTTATSGAPVRLVTNGDDLDVLSQVLLSDRRAFLYFRSFLGARRREGGWSCPRRDRSMHALVLQIYDWLIARGYDVDLSHSEIATAAVERELSRRRSFQRTSQAAQRLRNGETTFDFAGVQTALDGAGWQRPLRPHQQEAVALAMIAVNTANFSVPGAGKTASALAVAATHLHSGTIDLVVVVGPLACFDPWERETQACLGNSLSTRRARGTRRDRQNIYNRVGRRSLLLLSYSTAAADQAALLELFSRFNVMLVVDESHRIKRFRGGLWASAVLELARASRVRQVLSGTPMPQSGKDLYSQLNAIWPDQQLTGSRDTFASLVDRNFSRVATTVLPFVHRTPKSELGLPPYEVIEHTVPLQGVQAEVYQLIANRFRQTLADADTWQDKLDALRRGRPIRLLQAAANPDLLNNRDAFFSTPRVVAGAPTLMERLAAYSMRETPAKSLAALDIIRDIAAGGGKVVCWSNFVSNLDHFSGLVQERLNLPVYQIDGRVPSGDDALHSIAHPAERPGETDTREQIIAQFLDTPGPAVLVTNPASCSESISLHRTCWNAVYLDRTYDCALYLQSIDRIHRLGLPLEAHVRIHILTSELDGNPTIDGLVATALQRKASLMQKLLEGAEMLPVGLSEDPAADAEGNDTDLAELLRYLLGETSNGSP